MLTKGDLDAGATKWHLKVCEGPDRGRTVELRSGESVRVGTGVDNQLSLRDGSVSAHHLMLRLESDGVHLSDLHAAPRTSVGPVRVSNAVLPHGSVVRIGDTAMAIESDAPSATVSTHPSEAPPPRPYGESRRDAILAFEARYLADLVRLAGGNASHAARIAQMDRPHLLRLLRKHQLRSPTTASTLPPHSQVVVREDAATDPTELRRSESGRSESGRSESGRSESGRSEMGGSEMRSSDIRHSDMVPAEGRAMAVGDVESGLSAPRVPRIDYSGR